MAVGGSVAKAAEAQGIIDAAIQHFGKLDILVNNAGVYAMMPLEGVTEEEFHRQFNTNVLGLLLVTQAAAKHMADGGSIINIGSVAGRMGFPGNAVYSATKAGVDMITSVPRQGTREPQDPRQLAQPRPGENRGHRRFRWSRFRLREDGRGDDPAGPPRRDGRRGQGRRVPRLG